MRFSIRDLLWLLAVLALGLGWWVNSRALWLSRREIDDERIEVIKLAKELRENLHLARKKIEFEEEIKEAIFRGHKINHAYGYDAPDWSLLDEQIPPRKGYRAAREPMPISSAPAPNPPKK